MVFMWILIITLKIFHSEAVPVEQAEPVFQTSASVQTRNGKTKPFKDCIFSAYVYASPHVDLVLVEVRRWGWTLATGDCEPLCGGCKLGLDSL